MTRSIRTALLASVLTLGALSSSAAELQYRGTNQNLEEARALVGKARYEEALEELKVAEGLPGNTNRHWADLYALRASALLGLPESAERKEQASESLYLLWHIDPEGTALAGATLAARQLAQEVRARRTIILHDRLVTVRTGRAIRVRARLLNAPQGSVVTVHYRVEPELDLNDLQQAISLNDPNDYVRVDLEPAGNALEAYLRPGVGGVPNEGDHVLRYYLDAFGPDGLLLDSNGTAHQPIRMQISQTRTEGAGVGGADSILATLDEGGAAAHPPPPPPPPTPWYKRWEIVGPIGGAIIAGAVIAIVVAQPKPQPANGTLGRVDLP